MKCQKLFSLFAASAAVLALAAAPTKPAQAQWSSLLNYIPYAGSYISTAVDILSEGTTPLEAAGLYVPGIGGRVLNYVSDGVDITTGRKSLVEGVLGIVGGSVGGVAGGVLSEIRSGVNTYREAAGSSGYLQYGEQVPRQWTIRDDQGKDEVIDSQAWELTFANGEPKFVLVLEDGTRKEYPVDNLYNEEDLRYLCKYILGKLTGKEDSANADSGLSQNLKVLSQRLSTINDPVQLQIFFKYITDELSSVSLGVVQIAAGTRAGEKKVLTIRGEKWTFRWCPAGNFVMGSPASERLRQMNEKEHRVTLTQGFWILDSQVTCQMYSRVTEMSLDGRTIINPQQPMSGVDWNTSQRFCEELCAITNHSVVLPTEAQWEYACRAGSQNEFTDIASVSEVAWFAGNSQTSGTSGDIVRNGRRYPNSSAVVPAKHDVKGKKANAWGIYDMQGNVWEWCTDWYGSYSDADATDPQGPASGQFRIARGGSYTSPAASCRPAFRRWQSPGQKGGDFGFRVVLIPDAMEETSGGSANVPSFVPPAIIDAASGNAFVETFSAEPADSRTLSAPGSEGIENTAGFDETDDEDFPAVSENISGWNAVGIPEEAGHARPQAENASPKIVQPDNGGQWKARPIRQNRRRRRF